MQECRLERQSSCVWPPEDSSSEGLAIPPREVFSTAIIEADLKPSRTALFAVLALLGVVLVPPAPAVAMTLCDSLNAGRYDVIYVCPAAWRTQVARLAIHHTSSFFGGYSSIIAPTETVTTCFGAGRVGLRNLIDNALSSWTAPPKHVVLVGAFDSFDTTVAIIPTWFIRDPSIGFWTDAKRVISTDDPYVFEPGSSDSVPVVSLGRIPVWEAQGLRNYIDKAIDYDSQGPSAWKSRSLHLIDDGDFDGNAGYLIRQRADSLANDVIAQREAYFTRSLLYYSGAPQNYLLPPIQAWNAGLGFVLGYGARGDWYRVSYLDNGTNPTGSPIAYNYATTPRTFIDSLHVNHSYPVVLSMTCGGGYVRRWADYADYTLTAGSCIDQYLLATPNKGAVSVCGPSRAIRETAAYGYARQWLLAAFWPDNQPIKEPGRIAMLAKQRAMATLGAYKHEILSIHCLGDPAIQMPVDFTPTVGAGPQEPVASPRDLRVRAEANPSPAVQFLVDVPRAGSYQFELLDVSGRSLKSESQAFATAQRGVAVRMPSSTLPSGVYFLIVRGNGQIATGRIVLIR